MLNHRSWRMGALAVSLGATLVLSACAGAGGRAGDRTSAGAMTLEQRAARAPVDHDSMRELGYQFVWRGFPVLTRGGRLNHFELMDGLVTVMDTGNAITGLEMSSGRNRWSITLGQPLTRFVGLDQAPHRVIAASDNEVFILDANTGDPLDRQKLAVVVNTGPVVVDNVAVFGSVSGEVLGHNMATRYKQWGYLLRGAIRARPARAGDIVGVVSQSGDVIAIDAHTGSSTMRGRVFGGLESAPVAEGTRMYLAGLDQSVWSFDVYDGLQWRDRTEYQLRSQPTVSGGRLYVEIQGRGFVALEGATGEQVWAAPDAKGEAVGVRNGRLLVWNAGAREIIMLDPARGDELGRVPLPNIDRVRLSEFTDGDLYLATTSGVIIKFAPTS